MNLEVFAKTARRQNNPPTLSIAAKSGRIGLNKASAALLPEHTENVLLLWDKDEQVIGIRPIKKKDLKAFRITFNQGGGGAIAAKTFCDFIGIDYSETIHLSAEWNEGEGALIAYIASRAIVLLPGLTRPSPGERE